MSSNQNSSNFICSDTALAQRLETKLDILLSHLKTTLNSPLILGSVDSDDSIPRIELSKSSPRPSPTPYSAAANAISKLQTEIAVLKREKQELKSMLKESNRRLTILNDPTRGGTSTVPMSPMIPASNKSPSEINKNSSLNDKIKTIHTLGSPNTLYTRRTTRNASIEMLQLDEEFSRQENQRVLDKNNEEKQNAANSLEKHNEQHLDEEEHRIDVSGFSKAEFRILRADNKHCAYCNVPQGGITLGMRSTNLVRLKWVSLPKNVLLVKKTNDVEAASALVEVAEYLYKVLEMNVFVEPAIFLEQNEAINNLSYCKSWSSVAEVSELHRLIDFIVCLGGDGTLLWVNQLFKSAVPPVISFNLGSLGFLSPFPFGMYKEALEMVKRGQFHLTLRSRVVCTIVRKDSVLETPRESDDYSVSTIPPHKTLKQARSVTEQIHPSLIPKLSLNLDSRSSQSIIYPPTQQKFSKRFSHMSPPNVHVPPPVKVPAKVHSRHLSQCVECVNSNPVQGDDENGTHAQKEQINSYEFSNDQSPNAYHFVKPGDKATAIHHSIIEDEKIAFEDADSFLCLNEVIIDRGTSSYLTNLDCFVDGMWFTKVQADGIIIGTPTGSTAYSLSAGGSIINPGVPCITFTPVCPHSLSFRPMLLPDTCTLQVQVSEESRSSNAASFDGRNRTELKQGDSLLISMSKWVS